MVNLNWNDIPDKEVCCHVERIDHDFDQHRGIAWIPEHHATDARGIVDLFLKLDPKTKVVYVFCGLEPDIIYRIPGTLNWHGKPKIMSYEFDDLDLAFRLLKSPHEVIV